MFIGRLNILVISCCYCVLLLLLLVSMMCLNCMFVWIKVLQLYFRLYVVFLMVVWQKCVGVMLVVFRFVSIFLFSGRFGVCLLLRNGSIIRLFVLGDVVCRCLLVYWVLNLNVLVICLVMIVQFIVQISGSQLLVDEQNVVYFLFGLIMGVFEQVNRVFEVFRFIVR